MSRRYRWACVRTGSQVRSVAGPLLHFGGIGFVVTRPGECDAFLLRDAFQMVESESVIK